jgi:GNAT superfamily N-acetyltransferase
MSSTPYDITPYRPEWGPQVAELMVHLWGADIEANRAYLQWKHESNPYARQPMAIAALREGRVVGFRGFSPLPFRATGGADVVILCPGDTCVHPEHRMAGLSVKMGRAAMQAYGDRYPLFINWSCTQPSLPVYLKMGFRALVGKTYLTHAGPLGTLRYLRASRRARPLAQSRIRSGRYGAVEIAVSPRPAEMAALAAAEEAAPGLRRAASPERGRLMLRRDEAFFAWRFANPRGKYVFYTLLREDRPAGYVAIGLSPNNRRGFVLDFAEGEPNAIEGILRFILRARHLDVLSVYAFCLTAPQRATLEALGFRGSGVIPALETQRNGRLPLLIRPVKESFGEEDFLIEGADTRQLAAWSLKPIGSDAV